MQDGAYRGNSGCTGGRMCADPRQQRLCRPSIPPRCRRRPLPSRRPRNRPRSLRAGNSLRQDRVAQPALRARPGVARARGNRPLCKSRLLLRWHPREPRGTSASPDVTGAETRIAITFPRTQTAQVAFARAFRRWGLASMSVRPAAPGAGVIRFDGAWKSPPTSKRSARQAVQRFRLNAGYDHSPVQMRPTRKRSLHHGVAGKLTACTVSDISPPALAPGPVRAFPGPD